MISVLTFLCCSSGFSVYAAQQKNDVFYIRKQSEIQTMSLANDDTMPVSSERYDVFGYTDLGVKDPHCPNMGMGIKYLAEDENHPDGGGKKRYVYCLDHIKNTPENGLEMDFVGWADKKIMFALYHGAMYYGEPTRNPVYSTGDWRMDYFVTQSAIHVLNGEFDIESIKRGMDRGTAPEQLKNIALTMISRIVKDAETEEYYQFCTPDGWMDARKAEFFLESGKDLWNFQNGVYVSDGVFHPCLKTHMKYDFLEQLVGYDINVPECVNVKAHGDAIYSDFHLEIGKDQFEKWQLTGKTIPVEVTASLPKYWGAGIYKNRDSQWQSVCFLTYTTIREIQEFHEKKELHIPQISKDLIIQKKDNHTGTIVSGAKFSLWAYDGQAYTKKVADFEDLKDGRYMAKNIRFTDACEGKFLIREDQAPEGYEEIYCFENEEDKKQYDLYHGREIVMNTEGFFSPVLKKPLEFCEEKKEDPECSITIYKKIRAEEIDWDHGNPTFFFRIEGTTKKGEKKVFHRYITFTPKQVQVKDGWVTGIKKLEHLQPGIYQVEELDYTMRYILTNAYSEDRNVGVAKETQEYINGFGKIHANVEMDLCSSKSGSVTYENRKIRYDDYSDNSVKENHIRVYTQKQVTGE